MDDLARLRIGLALTGSHCTFDDIIPLAQDLVRRGADLLPIASTEAFNTDTRFGPADRWCREIEEICGKKMLHTIVDVEPVGPDKLLDAILIAPCTGNTMAKLAHGITDTPVIMATKAHLRNRRPAVLGISTNDALGLNAPNLGTLLAARGMYFVPFRQDDPAGKPTSCIAEWDLAGDALRAAVQGEQLQPVLLGPQE